MNKSDLKTGMIVETRDRGKYLVMRNPECENRELISFEDGWMPLCDYDEYLLMKNGSKDFDIVKVYSAGSSICKLFDRERLLNGLKLLWQRTEEPIEMTIGEIEEKLGIKKLRIIKE